eukprot:15442487-Alexandrium_andersonii.AAC.1
MVRPPPPELAAEDRPQCNIPAPSRRPRRHANREEPGWRRPLAPLRAAQCGRESYRPERVGTGPPKEPPPPDSNASPGAQPPAPPLREHRCSAAWPGSAAPEGRPAT